MKKKMKIQTHEYLQLILILLAITYINLNAQEKTWVKVDTCTLNNVNTFYASVESIKCIDSNNCISWTSLNGGGYFFKRTTDGGTTWKIIFQDSGYFHNVNDYHFVPNIWDISYPNKKLFIAVGDSGLIVRSTDNGDTWQSYRFDTTFKIGMIQMLDENYGIMGASLQHDDYYIKGGGIFETYDGGLTWGKVNYSLDTNLAGFSIEQIFDRKTWCGFTFCLDCKAKGQADNKILWMRNGWKTWDTLAYPQYPGLILDFVDENNGWLAGGLFHDSVFSGRLWEVIYHTSDGGKHWDTQWDTIYNLLSLNDIKFFDKDFGIAVGGYGHVLMTNDGGKHWNSMMLFDGADKYGGNCDIRSIQIPSRDVAYVMFNNNYIYKYTWDNGEAVPENPVPKIFSILPNPAESYIYINLPSEFLTEKIKIYSIEGILVYQTSDILKMSDVSAKIDVSRFTAGVYYVMVGARVCRFIKI